MLLKLSVPYLAEVKEVIGYPVWVTSEGKWGILVALNQLDSEATSLLSAYQRLGEYFRQLPTGIKLRFFSRTRAHYEEKNHFRMNEINELGSLNTHLLMSVEFSHSFVSIKSIFHKTRSWLAGSIDFSVSEFEVKALLSKVDLGALNSVGLDPTPATTEQVRDLWPWEDLEIGDYGQNIDMGPSLLTTLRLWKPGVYPISSSTLSDIKTKLYDEVDFTVSIQKVGEAKSTLRLNRKQKQAKAGNTLIDAIQTQDAEQQLSEALLEGSTHFEVEWLAILQRNNEERLRQDALTLSRELRQLGDIYQETVGAAESLVASFPGGETVQTFTEKDYHLPYYLPLASQGRSQKDVKEVSLHSLCVGRRDGSLDYIDFWQRSNSNFSAIIGGASGKGKTVLLQMLLSALHHNPEMRITSVDAGGSSLSTCKKLGAEIHDLNLGHSSGINPFEWISDVDDLSFLDQTLSTFLGTLILEEKETCLAKELKATLEKEVYKFIRSQKLGHFNGIPTNPDGKDLSMDGFIGQLPKDFPRKILFERWAKGGKFAEVIKTNPNRKGNIFSKAHHCYNFTSIDQAADKDFAQAAGALVLAQANLESWRAKQIPGLIYAQIFDETKFLFRRCIEQFLLLIANVRKLGQSIVLVNQDTSDFLVPSGISESRLTIFNNCQTHILFYDESKGETREEVMQKGEESFPGRHGLNEREYQLVRSLQGNPPYYSEFFIKDGRGSRVSRLALTPNEYWRVTSDSKDLAKKNKLKQALPELTEEEIIQWMIKIDLKIKEKSFTPVA